MGGTASTCGSRGTRGAYTLPSMAKRSISLVTPKQALRNPNSLFKRLDTPLHAQFLRHTRSPPPPEGATPGGRGSEEECRPPSRESVCLLPPQPPAWETCPRLFRAPLDSLQL